MNKILTIVIPSYNVETTLKSTIDSLLVSDLLNDIEILVIDDGSKDRTSEIANEFETDYPDCIRAIHKENGGHGSAINRGIKEAAGKYFRVLDGDDWFDEKAYRELVSFLKETDSDIVFNPYLTVNDRTGEEILKDSHSKTIPEKQKFIFDDIASEFDLPMHSATFKTELIKKIPSVDEKCFYVDSEYVLFPIVSANTVAFLNSPLYRYRVFSDNQSMTMKNLQKNIEYHERVVRRCTKFYEENKDSVSEQKKAYMKKRMRQLIEAHYGILFSFPRSSSVFHKIRKFSSELKTESPDLYQASNHKMIWLFRKMPSVSYPIIVIRNKNRRRSFR